MICLHTTFLVSQRCGLPVRFLNVLKIGFIIVHKYIRESLTMQNKIECVFVINGTIQEPVLVTALNVTDPGR